MLGEVAGLFNNGVANVPNCWPVDEADFSGAIAAVCGGECDGGPSVDDQALSVAALNGRVVGFAHTGIDRGDSDEAPRGAICFLYYERRLPRRRTSPARRGRGQVRGALALRGLRLQPELPLSLLLLPPRLPLRPPRPRQRPAAVQRLQAHEGRGLSQRARLRGGRAAPGRPRLRSDGDPAPEKRPARRLPPQGAQGRRNHW